MDTVALPRLRAARLGVSILFIANALVFATVVTRYPEVKDRFGLDEFAFGLMVACGPIGSIVGSLFAGRLVARLGAVRVAAGSSIAMGLLLSVIGFADGPVMLAVLFFAIGFGDATGDVGNNAHGLVIQRLMGRSIINGLHGAWSAGAIAGALIGAAALQLRIPIGVHVLAVGGLILLGSVVAIRLARLQTAPAPALPTAPSRRPTRLSAMLLAACVIATIGAFLEDLGSTWGGVFATTETGATTAEAAIPFVALMGALTVGRFASDTVVNRVGSTWTMRGGAVLAFAGIVLVVLAPATWVVAVALGFIGLGIAPMIPLAMDAADRVPGLAPGSGLAAAGISMRVGLFASPVMVGAVAHGTGLRLGFAICLVAAVIAYVLASRLRGDTAAT